MKIFGLEIKIAKKTVCPRCERNIKYDCSQDAYIINKQFSSEKEATVSDTTGSKNLIISYCVCGKILGISVEDECGSELYEHPKINGNEIII